MHFKIFQYYATATAKLYCNAVVHPSYNKFLVARLKSPVLNHALPSRGYTNQSMLVNQEYEKKYEEQLNENLKDPNYAAKYNKCKLEVEHLRSLALRVPETLKPYDWLYLLNTDTKSQRRAYLQHLWKIEKKTENVIKKQEIKRQKKLQEKESGCTKDDMEYKLSFNTLFHRIRDTTIMHFYNSRLMNAMLYSSPIVLDVSYDEHMTLSEKHLCAKQLLLAFSANRVHDDPCNLYFCNTDKNSIIMQQLHKTIPTLYDIDFPLNITSESYLKIFDKSKLVYLTPHCKHIMTDYEPNAIYIIGAMIDKVNRQPISYQKAKREGIKMAKLPLSEKLDWGTGSTKTLPLNQVLSILLDLRYTNDWNTALKHIPKRKLRESREQTHIKKFAKRQQLIERLLKYT